MADGNTALSICIASYNYAEYLEYAFEQIKAQDFTDCEILYCDDASSDNSVEVIRKIIYDNPNMKIRLIENRENQGLISTKNRLITEARGTYIMLCDADDYMLPGCLSTLMDAATGSNADRVCAQVVDRDNDGRDIQVQEFAEAQSKWLWNLHHGCVYKRSIIADNDIVIKVHPDDVDFITRFNRYAEKTIFIKKNLYVWRVHQDSSGKKSQTEGESRKELVDMFREIKCVENTLDEDDTDDLTELRLLYIKIYYLYVLKYEKAISWAARKNKWRALRQVIDEYYPGFYNNSLLKNNSREVLRPYAIGILRVCSWAEKCHMFTLALYGYHIMSKVKYFDQ